ncbi:MAG: hypothetical protein MK364_15435 [Pirellulales bacterium]|nr:hypothetical protein [Pirellulales bacterium]
MRQSAIAPVINESPPVTDANGIFALSLEALVGIWGFRNDMQNPFHPDRSVAVGFIKEDDK